MASRTYALCFLLLVLLQLHVEMLSAAVISPRQQRGCLQECGQCAACVQRKPHTDDCAILCLLCDMCHACFRGVCEWEVRPVPEENATAPSTRPVPEENATQPSTRPAPEENATVPSTLPASEENTTPPSE